jgi:ketosteroid isomerase-like protein
VESDTIRQLREGYAAFNRGEYEEVLEQWDPEVAVHDRPEVPDPRDYEGLEGARQAFAGVVELFAEYEIEPVEFIDGGEQVVAVLRQRGRGRSSGVEVEGEIVHVWNVKEGKVMDLRAFSSKQDALEHLGWPSS